MPTTTGAHPERHWAASSVPLQAPDHCGSSIGPRVCGSQWQVGPQGCPSGCSQPLPYAHHPRREGWRCHFAARPNAGATWATGRCRDPEGTTTRYTPTLEHARTDEERRDPFLSWSRDDEAFFAAGACHILAFLFVQLHQHEGFEAVLLRPQGGAPGTHVFASDGRWAFDFNGWVRQEKLLKVTTAAYRAEWPNWRHDLVPLGPCIDQFCRQYAHRSPQCFAYLPWERAYRYLQRFPTSPPAAGRTRRPATRNPD